MKKIKDPREHAIAQVWSGRMAMVAAAAHKDPVWERSAKTHFINVCLPLIQEWDIKFHEVVPSTRKVTRQYI